MTTKEQLEKVKRANAYRNVRKPYLKMANKFYESLLMLREHRNKKK